MAGQHWVLSVGVLWWFDTALGCEKPCECQVQPQPLGIVLLAWLWCHDCPGQPQTVTIRLWSGLALCMENFGPGADGSRASKTQAVKVISEVFGQEITRDLYSLSSPNGAAIKRNMKLRKM